MRKTRLFPTLVLYGASLTGGAIATVATVAVTISGCGDDATGDAQDMSLGRYPDIGVPFRVDMSHLPVDCGLPCGAGD